MNKESKNIILILIMVLMLVCSYFTVKCIYGRNIPNINDDIRNKISTNEESNKEDTIQDKEINPSDTTQDSTTSRSKNSTRRTPPNRPSRNNNSNNNTNKDDNVGRGFEDFNFNKDSFNKVGRSNNTLYIILFGLESAIFGGCAVLLIAFNTNILKEDKKRRIKGE